MEERLFKKYIILWLSQSISGLGSSMTGFAIVLWAYGQSHSAMSVSLMSFCNYVPYVLLSLFAAGGLPLVLLIDLASFVFAFCVLLFFITIPVGIILGGWLADYVFEPFMVSGNRLAEMLEIIVGDSAGSGMAAMFLCTGICGFTVSIASCFNREIKKLN